MKTKHQKPTVNYGFGYFSMFIFALSVAIGLLSLFPTYITFNLQRHPVIPFLSFSPPAYPNLENVTKVLLDNHLKYINIGKSRGPETVAFNSKGDLYFSSESGEIRYLKAPIQFSNAPDSSIDNSLPFIHTGGRPLGIKFDKDDNLLIADPVKGLLKFERGTNTLTILTGSANGTKLLFIDDVKPGDDGIIYFSDSFGMAPFIDNTGQWNTEGPSFFVCATMQTKGKLLSYNPVTLETKVLVDGLTCGNGVTLDEKGESVFITETCKYRVIRYWIKGPKAGKSEVFAENLPGYPDGIEMAPNNRLYVTLFCQRTIFDHLQPYPLLKRLYLSIPYHYVPSHSLSSIAVLDANNGRILEILETRTNHMITLTSTTRKDNKLYMGKMFNNNSYFSILVFALSIIVCVLAWFPTYQLYGNQYWPDLEFQRFDYLPLTSLENVTKKLEKKIKYLDLGEIHGPESISFNRNGDLYFSTGSGEIRYMKAPFDFIDSISIGKPMNSYHYVHTGGRPLGIDFDRDDNLLIADSAKGLFRVDKDSGDMILLTATVNNTKLNFVNDVTSNFEDGLIYFSDSTKLAPFLDNSGDWNTKIPSLYTCATSAQFGKLLSYDPATKQTKILLEGISYANGVALDEKGESLYLVETCRYRVIKYWLKGPNTGKSHVIVDNLPGYPDGIDYSDGKLYISIFSKRTYYDYLYRYPLLRKLFHTIPNNGVPLGPPSIIIADSHTGEIMESLETTSNHFKTITCTYVHENKLYLGKK
ncbi:strictosidine synthase family protein [Heterostelium album PN500]|uniref:Strictosidine synthase family protein n=1 Tax=Heterostelium pallidum (strain ATCC 26659 / Pp 5 / PN500) TaxID=670386 RepID=D3B0G6_HETP5|nr:strictosidine synthase family protein [Heterostelium album PN500]EFA84790.1 strictosidine synthase family protein [Heterostelium album PN500]|eukprot:XP_020436902.1 strictosidine synthase family protein [Heterostelium album PN500]